MFHIHVALVWFYLFLQDGTQNKSDLKKIWKLVKLISEPEEKLWNSEL